MSKVGREWKEEKKCSYLYCERKRLLLAWGDYLASEPQKWGGGSRGSQQPSHNCLASLMVCNCCNCLTLKSLLRKNLCYCEWTFFEFQMLFIFFLLLLLRFFLCRSCRSIAFVCTIVIVVPSSAVVNERTAKKREVFHWSRAKFQKKVFRMGK